MSGSNAAFRNDPRAAEYLARQYRRLHQEDLFIPDQRYTKAEARSEAFRRLLIARQQGRV